MKIEKINDNQIRCTLTSADLANRELKLSELAYGTEKAKDLFRDMMQQAHKDFGFEADNIPLMIEAIPVSPDSIVLIITKVEDPEELDTRFSRFSQPEDSSGERTEHPHVGADDILDIFQKLSEAKKAKGRVAEKEVPDSEKNEDAKPVNVIRLFLFNDLNDVIRASHTLNRFFDGYNTLYKNSKGEYALVIHQSELPAEDFNRVCNMLSEFGNSRNFSAAGESYLLEHADIIIHGSALQELASF